MARRRATTSAPPSKPSNSSSKPAEPPPPKPSPSNHFRNITLITTLVGGPYALWLGYLFVHLQTNLLRPPVLPNGTRQLLVVATQSAGTTDLTKRLQSIGLEVEHESSDAAWSFARDGTISWMHALRFLPGHATEPQLAGLCGSSMRNMGFHPAMFRAPRRGCSYRSAWDGCWAAECRDIVAAEWGCASRGGAAACETPFATTLLQARHPLRVVESLVVKFCRSLDEPPHQYATSFFAALWPEAVKWDDLGCARTFGWFWTLYNEAMLAAHESGHIASWFRIEDLHDPCELARTAGFLDASSVVSRDYAHAAATAACTPDGRSRQPPTSTASRRNTRNKGQVSLTVADLAGPDDGDLGLAARLTAVAAALGYHEL